MSKKKIKTPSSSDVVYYYKSGQITLHQAAKMMNLNESYLKEWLEKHNIKQNKTT